MSDSGAAGSGDGRIRRIVREDPTENREQAMEESPDDLPEPPVVVRMRNGTTFTDDQQKQNQANGNAAAAIQSGVEALAEQELDESREEIKKLDTQLDHFNKYVDTFEKRNTELTERLTKKIQAQREDRLKRRASFMQREEEYKAQQNSFENQLQSMLSRCAQSRRTSVPVFGPDAEKVLQQGLQRGGGGGAGGRGISRDANANPGK